MKKYSRKRMSTTFIVLSLVLCISIGYAVLTTALKINSAIGVGKISFAIHFDNVQPLANKATINEAAHITDGDTKKEISFDIFLAKLDDDYKFTTDIVNEGSIPGKIKSIELQGLTDSQKRIIAYNLRYTSSNKKLAVGDYIGPYSSKNVTVEIIYELSQDVEDEDLPQDDMNLNCTLIINFENGSLTEMRSRAAATRLSQDVNYMPTSSLRFNQSTNSDEHSGLYRLDGTENDDFPIYFYRGNHSSIHNHVKFANYCWRIIRTTETGGIKIIYNGAPNEEGQCVNTTGAVTNLSTHDYGSNNYYLSSNIRPYLNTWYFEHLITYQAYLEDTTFCNGNKYRTGYYESSDNYSLACESDKQISLSNNVYPIGLITASEANLCGLSPLESNYPWLYTGVYYWTMSGGSDMGGRYILFVDPTGKINYYDSAVYSGAQYGVRPVLSLNSEVIFDTGDGTTTNPYTVSLG